MLNFDQMEKMTLQILPYLPATLELLLLSLLLAIVLGLGAALSRIYRIPVLQRVSQAYILLGRAVPTLIILYVVFYGLPMILLMIRGQADLTLIAELPPFAYAVVGLGLHSGAYLAEIFYSAFYSVPKGQIEASQVIGLSTYRTVKNIILPQALTFALPMMANEVLNLLKGTSIAALITVVELFGAANIQAALTNLYLEIYISAALIYWALSIAIERGFRFAERRAGFYLR